MDCKRNDNKNHNHKKHDDPFRMPERTKSTICRSCNGTGHELEMGEEICNSCIGTGRDKTSDCWAEPCRTCNGKGRVPYCRRSLSSCRQCNGSGRITY